MLGVIGGRDSPAWLRGVATAVPNPKSPAGYHSDKFASLSLLILLKVVPFSCGPAPHFRSRLAALIHMHMLESSCRGRHRNDTSIATEGSPKPVKCTAIAALCVQAICITRAHSSSPRAWRPR